MSANPGEFSGLKAPLLYLSLFFKRHREEYFRRLTAVRTDGDWEGWTDFFLDGVATIAEEAVTSARELFAVVTADRGRVLAQDTTSVSAVRLFELLPNHPIITVATAMKLIETSKPTATRAIETLAAAGILVDSNRLHLNSVPDAVPPEARTSLHDDEVRRCERRPVRQGCDDRRHARAGAVNIPFQNARGLGVDELRRDTGRRLPGQRDSRQPGARETAATLRLRARSASGEAIRGAWK